MNHNKLSEFEKLNFDKYLEFNNFDIVDYAAYDVVKFRKKLLI